MIGPDSYVFIDGETMTLNEAHTRFGTGSFPQPIIENCFSVADYMRIPFAPPLGLLSGGLIPQKSKSLLFGEPKTGKSFIALQMGEAIAERKSWLGFDPHPSDEFIPKVLYLQTEISEAEFRERLNGLPSAPNNFFVETVHGQQLLGAGYEELIKRVSFIHPDIVILDPLYMLMEGDLNSSTHMSYVHRNIDNLIENFSCAVMIIHHSRKPNNDTKTSIMEALGSVTITAFYDSIIFLERKQTVNLMHFTLRHSASPEPIALVQLDTGLFAPLFPLPHLTNDWQTVDSLAAKMNLIGFEKAVLANLNYLVSQDKAEKTTNRSFRNVQ